MSSDLAPEAPVYLVGSTGLPNYGDELIMRLWLRHLCRLAPEVPVWVDCPNPGIAAALFADDHAGLRCTDTLWRTAWLIHERTPGDPRELAEQLLRTLGTPRQDLGLAVLRNVRSVHLVGGGYLNSMWTVNSTVALLASLSAAVNGHRVFGSGLGLAPQDATTIDRLGQAFGSFEIVEVRDRPEDLELRPAGVTFGVDDAFLAFDPDMLPVWAHREAGAAPQYMLLVQGDMHPSISGREACLTVALDELRLAGWSGERVGLVEAIPPDDAWMRGRLEAAGVEVVFYPFMGLWEEGLPIREGQYWVSTRFHTHLLVAGRGVAGTAIAISDDYYGSKHRSLLALGTGWRLVDQNGQVLEAGDPVRTRGFAARARELAERKLKLADQLYGSLRQPTQVAFRRWLGRFVEERTTPR